MAAESGFEGLREVAALRATKPAGAAPSLQPGPVARMVAAGAESQPVSLPLHLPPFTVMVNEDLEQLREAAALRATDPAGAAPSLQPAPLARLVVAVAELQPASAPLHMPLFTMAVSEDPEQLREAAALRATDPAGAAPSLQPAPLARLVVAVAELQPTSAPLRLPLFAMMVSEDLERLREDDDLRATERAGAAPSLQPAPVARLVVAAAELAAADTVPPAVLPSFRGPMSISALAHRPQQAALLRMGGEEQISGGAKEPHTGAAVLPFQRAGRMPRFDMIPAPPIGETWMAAPLPSLAARMVIPSLADPIAPTAREPEMPSMLQPVPSAAALQLPEYASWQSTLCPEAALVDVIPNLVTDSALTGSVLLPGMPSWQAKDSLGGVHARRAETPGPEAVEAWPSVEAATPIPANHTPRMAFPILTLGAVSGSARLDCSTEPDMAPRPALPAPAAAQAVAPMIGGAFSQRRILLGNPSIGGLAETATATLPSAGFASMDFHCRPQPGALTNRPQWILSAIPIALPHLSVPPAFDRWEVVAAPPPPAKDSIDKVVVIRRTVLRFASSKRARNAVGAIAAGLFLGTALWFGSGSAGHKFDEVTPEVAMNDAPAAGAPVAGQRAPSGTISRLRQAVADRAAVSWSDSFRGGMAAWGAGAKSWAPGWARSADGYVQPGSLAIFHPTAKYTDYTLEFFGQIEHKSMDWVVRAHDPQNYYAMKFTVVESGLRPMIAMVHYAVVGGKRRHYSQTPLNVMVHNSQPMQVLVGVKGNHFTASVDGQEVGSWTDDTPTAGGVGFFAEAGEKARLYWMRVSKNEDFIGRVCAYFSGSASRQTGELWPQNPYGRPHQGGPATPNEPAEALGLAAVVTVRRSRMRNLAYRIAPYFAERRIETWRS